jgi:hypothetical protein
VEDQLRDAIAITQVNEEHATQIAAAMYPPHQERGLADVRHTQLAATVRAAQVSQEI